MIRIRKISEEHGWGNNMSPHPIEYNGKTYNTAEALFQCLRFDDESIIDKIRAEGSVMGAKFVAIKNEDKMVVKQKSESDIDNMRLCLKLKIEQHPEIEEKLRATESARIVEDTAGRKDQFWGAKWEHNGWQGHNWMGELWMELRKGLK